MKTNGTFFRSLPRWIGVAICCFALMVIVSWYEHWQWVIQLVPGTAPMQFNTALGFIVSGAALILLTTRRVKAAACLGGVVAVFTTLTLLEYLMGRNFGIDLIFYTPYFEAATTYAGRMSPLTAVCFMLTGSGIGLAGGNLKWPHRLAVAGMLMCIVAVISFVALVGFIFGIESAYGWGAYSSMAVNTAALFLFLSLGVLASAWEKAQSQNYNFIRWLPVTASVTLIVMVAFVAMGDMKGLKAATYWRQHTIKVILASQTFENNLVDLQRGMRGYVTTGDTNALAAYEKAAALEPQALQELTDLSQDNPEQQQRLKRLQGLMKNLLFYDTHLMETYEVEGSDAVFKMDSSGRGRNVFGHAHDVLREFTQAEQNLLNIRDTSEEASYRNTEHLLVVSCVLATLLLLLANFMASHELARRHQAEAKLAVQAEALRRSNEELQQFAYVASHDLREPLRTVTGFAQILKRHCENRLDEKADQTINRIIEGARRMSDIIDDLLVLSSISSQKKPFENTKLETPLALAVENLSVTVSERGAMVSHGPLPTLPVDGSQLVLLFQNLIGNAIKFCADRVPEVYIESVREADGCWRISVQDNGIGIEPKYFDKIFGIFQRLHTREAFPGTGIGLAICKKIVERHGGRIWLESIPGRGTKFHFTLAERQHEKYEGIQPTG